MLISTSSKWGAGRAIGDVDAGTSARISSIAGALPLAERPTLSTPAVAAVWADDRPAVAKVLVLVVMLG
jgi:hypothetical protein